MHVIVLKLVKGEYDHLSKCWTLISTGRSRCPTILYWVNTDINGIPLFLQLLLLYSVLHFDQLTELKYLYKANAKRLGLFFNRLSHSDSLSEVAQKYAQFRQE